jgi:hypothetical protein
MVDVLMGQEDVLLGETFYENFLKHILGTLDYKCWKTKHLSIPKGSRCHETLRSGEHILSTNAYDFRIKRNITHSLVKIIKFPRKIKPALEHETATMTWIGKSCLRTLSEHV